MKYSLLLAVLAALAPTALAGDCAGGFSCSNMCPLAKEANVHRSTGREALAASASVRAALVAQVERNLAKV